MCFFSQAVFTYWMTSNLFSLGQVALLRHPVVREKLSIPARITHAPTALPPSEGFVESVRKGTAWTCAIECVFHMVILLFLSP